LWYFVKVCLIIDIIFKMRVLNTKQDLSVLRSLQGLINTNHLCKEHHDPIIHSWFIAELFILLRCISDLDLWPCYLDLWSTSTSHICYPYVRVSSISDHPLVICSGNVYFLHDCIFDHDLWSTSTSCYYDSCVRTLSSSNHPYMIYRLKNFLHNSIFDLDLW